MNAFNQIFVNKTTYSQNGLIKMKDSNFAQDFMKLENATNDVKNALTRLQKVPQVPPEEPLTPPRLYLQE
jgi:hypothetical protein